MSIALVVAVAIPAVLFVAWPLVRRRTRGSSLFLLPPDPRQQLLEEKEAAGRALCELAFEHEAGYLSDDDYVALRDRYELRAAETLLALDALDTSDRMAAQSAPMTGIQPRTGRPAVIAISATALLVLGLLLGLGVARYSTPGPAVGPARLDPRPLAPPVGGGAAGDVPAKGSPALTPEVLEDMLRAARASLAAGRYSEAIAAYRAVLQRDHANVDALTHLGLLVAIGGHADAALETLDQALAYDPNYPPALFYRGRVLHEIKRDYTGAAKSWDKFLAVVPEGPEHDRVAALARDARSRLRGASPSR